MSYGKFGWNCAPPRDQMTWKISETCRKNVSTDLICLNFTFDFSTKPSFDSAFHWVRVAHTHGIGSPCQNTNKSLPFRLFRLTYLHRVTCSSMDEANWIAPKNIEKMVQRLSQTSLRIYSCKPKALGAMAHVYCCSANCFVVGVRTQSKLNFSLIAC